MDITLTYLHSYPVKSLAGISLAEAVTEDRGLPYDRRWMLVDDAGIFLSQRKIPEMALVKLRLDTHGLLLEAPSQLPLSVGFGERMGLETMVKVWDDTCRAYEVSTRANEWLSNYLGQSCRLVYMPDETQRVVDPVYNLGQNITSFSDGFPFLLISEASLTDLNSRLPASARPLPMNRFRPNLVVGGTEPYAEDTWKRIKIGEVVFHVVKPCSRCVMTTIDQDTGEKGIEPLKTMSQYRRVGSKIMFGQNLLQETNGMIRVGDRVEVLDRVG